MISNTFKIYSHDAFMALPDDGTPDYEELAMKADDGEVLSGQEQEQLDAFLDAVDEREERWNAEWAAMVDQVDAEIAEETFANGWGESGNFEAILSGEFIPLQPTILSRNDGVCLVYPGKMHSFSGESEASKSWIAMIAGHDVLAEGGKVLYIDFDDSEESVVGRMRALGSSPDELRRGFTYRRPESKPVGPRAEKAFKALMNGGYDLVIIDGVTAAIKLWMLGGRLEDDVAEWIRVFPRMFSRKGAAVVMLDHVTKSADGNNRYAIGSQQKLNDLDGAAYIVECVTPFGIKRTGESKLLVSKDRPGAVRAASSTGGGRQEAARLVLQSHDDGKRVTWELRAPGYAAPTGDLVTAVDFVIARIRELNLEEEIKGLSQTKAVDLMNKKEIEARGTTLRDAYKKLTGKG